MSVLAYGEMWKEPSLQGTPVGHGSRKLCPLEGTTWNEEVLSPSTWEGGANDGVLGPEADLPQEHKAPSASTLPWRCLAPQRAEALCIPKVAGSRLGPD